MLRSKNYGSPKIMWVSSRKFEFGLHDFPFLVPSLRKLQAAPNGAMGVSTDRHMMIDDKPRISAPSLNTRYTSVDKDETRNHRR